MCIFLILLINHSVLSELLSMPFLIASQAWFPQTFYITEMSKFYDSPFVVFGWIQFCLLTIYLIKMGITESSVVLLPEIEDVFSPILRMTLARCIFSLVNGMTYWFVTYPSRIGKHFNLFIFLFLF